MIITFSNKENIKKEREIEIKIFSSTDEFINSVIPFPQLRQVSSLVKTISLTLLNFKIFKLVHDKPFLCVKCTECIDRCLFLMSYIHSESFLFRVIEHVKRTEELNKNTKLIEVIGKFLRKKIHGFISYLSEALSYQNSFNCKVLRKLYRRIEELKFEIEFAYLI